MKSMETYDPHKNPTETRQGSKRNMNLRVLIFSTLGIVVLLALVFIIYTAMQPNPT
jgi:hypothetical protein